MLPKYTPVTQMLPLIFKFLLLMWRVKKQQQQQNQIKQNIRLTTEKTFFFTASSVSFLPNASSEM